MQLYAASVTDGYKVGHAPMYADGTTKVYSNLTPRSDKIYLRNCTKFYDGKLVFVGAQGAVQEIKEMWDDFFASPKEVVVGKYARRMAFYLGGNEIAVKCMDNLHDLGFLPLEIKSLPEGSKVKMGIPVMTITNTLASFYWLTNYLETVLSALVWKTATNATIAAEYKAICKHYAELTGTDDFTVSIQCHDFSMRGMSGPEDAARSGFGHLTSFIGTDTLPAMDYAEDYYDADLDSLIAISVPATEHAVATSNILAIESELTHKYGINDPKIRLVSEKAFIYDLITRKFPTGVVSYVADSFDFWAVLTEILPSLKDVILAREASNVAPGKLVIRPDSGDPVEVVCGKKPILWGSEKAFEFESHQHFFDFMDTKIVDEFEEFDCVKIAGKFYAFSVTDRVIDLGTDEIPYAIVAGAVAALWKTFGGTTTATGHKLLDSRIGLIYGDSITTKRAEEILRRLAAAGFASGNVVFGVGSYTYQCNTRDTFGFAVKATYTEVDGEGIAIFKDPKTDSKKKSAKGLLFVGPFGGNVADPYMIDDVRNETEASPDNMLQTIFKDGQWVKRTSLEEIRARLA